MWELYNSDPANLQESGQGSRCGHNAIGDIHLIVGHQLEAAREETKNKVGLA